MSFWTSDTTWFHTALVMLHCTMSMSIRPCRAVLIDMVHATWHNRCRSVRTCMTSHLPATIVHIPNIASLHTTASLPVQILLVTEQGEVLEGTQTNFFAIQNNKLHTAQEGILMGTVRGVVLQVHCTAGVHCTCTSHVLYSSLSLYTTCCNMSFRGHQQSPKILDCSPTDSLLGGGIDPLPADAPLTTVLVLQQPTWLCLCRRCLHLIGHSI